MNESDYLSKNLNFVSRENKTSLILMVTYNCQMMCSYCNVNVGQKKGVMKDEVYKKAINLLFSLKSDNIVLQFFGGEPLLYPKLVLDIINYAEHVKKDYPSKKLRYLITTNGLNLKEDVLNKLNKFNTEIMISIDGNIETMKKYRKIKGDDNDYKLIFQNLKNIQKKDLSYFVNMLVTPKNVHSLFENFNYLINQGVKRIQVCYESGVLWDKRSILELLGGLEKAKKLAGRKSVFFMNLRNACEPVMVTGDIIIDVDGKIYFDAAIFHEKPFPKFRTSCLISHVNAVESIQDLFSSKKALLDKFTSIYPPGTRGRKILENNIKLGLVLKEFVEEKLQENKKKTENRKFSGFLPGTVEDQINFKQKNNMHLEPYFLHITNMCMNDCLFCKNKSLPNSSLEFVEYKLRTNKKHHLSKMCVVGNEPLNHPKILDILDLCGKYGFKEIEVMASGSFLSNKNLIRKLVDKGVRSFSLPLYSYKPGEHDKIVQKKGDFSHCMKGIENIKSFPELKLYIHTNLLKQNIGSMSKLENFAKQKIGANFCILPIRPKKSNLPYSELVPSYSEMIDKLNVKSLVGFPICVVNKIQKNKFIDSNEISDSIKLYMLDQNYAKLKKCRGCTHRHRCAGTFKEFIKLYGKDEIMAMLGD